jgi:hypothetical protein
MPQQRSLPTRWVDVDRDEAPDDALRLRGATAENQLAEPGCTKLFKYCIKIINSNSYNYIEYL